MNCFMSVALEEARKAYFEGNVPVGAVMVYKGKIIAFAHNTKNTSNIAINHAEILCIVKACEYLNSWYLNECELYVTLEPCDMCMLAIAEARIRKVYYLMNSNYNDNMKRNKEKICFNKLDDNDDYEKLVTTFFEKIRN